MEQWNFQGLRWERYFKNYVTPREWKHGSRDMPFGLGAKSLYVDGTNGDDSNDGLSWKTPKSTIQKAVDIADTWTDIYIKASAYDEKITVVTPSIRLIGENKQTTIVKPSTTGDAIAVQANGCSVSNLKAIGNDTLNAGIRISAKRASVSDVIVGNSLVSIYTFGLVTAGLTDGEFTFASHIELDSIDIPGKGVYFSSNYGALENSVLNNARDKAIIVEGFYNIITNNSVDGSPYGIGTGDDPEDTLYNSIYHNNITNCTVYARGGTGNVLTSWYENFYGNHTNIDNGFGIATEAYNFSHDSDPRPVVRFNGWKFLSMGSTITDILDELELEAIHASYVFPEDTNETVTFTAGGTNNTFGAWAEIVDNNAVTFSSKLASNEGHISTLAIESANTNDKIYLIEIAYGAAKTIVVRHRFKTGVGVEKFQLCRMRTLKIPSGETVYYRMKCETASATCVVDFKYHFHP